MSTPTRGCWVAIDPSLSAGALADLLQALRQLPGVRWVGPTARDPHEWLQHEVATLFDEALKRLAAEGPRDVRPAA